MSPRQRVTHLIVNADDFGLSDPINRGIVEAHERGIVTSTSIMPVGGSFDSAVQLAKGLPQLDVGVHLTLVGEKALMPASRIPTLVDDAGRLPQDVFSFVRRYLTGRISLSDVRAELAAQFERVASAGIRLTHADSHQHVHVLGGIRETVAQLCETHAVKVLRRPAEPFRRHLFTGSAAPRRLVELAAIRLACSGSWPRQLYCAEPFFGFYFGGRLSLQALLAIIDSLPHGRVSELMCHPGRRDERYAAWGYGWEEELGALTDEAAKKALADRGIKLTGFRSVLA